MFNQFKAIMFFVALLFFAVNGAFADAADNSALKDEIRALLRDNPEIILDILRENDVTLLEMLQQAASKRQQAASKRQGQEEQRRFQSEIKNPLKPDIEKGRPVRGNPDAQVTIVAYDDFQCPFCARGAVTLDKIMEKYKGKVRFFLKHNPLDFHKQALPAALYFEAIARQDHEKAWKFHDMAFEQQDSLKKGKKAFDKIASSLDVDSKRIESDLKDPALKAIIDKDMREARKFGFNGTPSFVINGVSLRGAHPEQKFSEVIDYFLSKKK